MKTGKKAEIWFNRLSSMLVTTILIIVVLVIPLSPVDAVNTTGVVTPNLYQSASGSNSPGAPWAWGQNYNGELGIGALGYSFVPVQVNGISNVIDVAGGYHSLAVDTDGAVWTWGNWYGTCSSTDIRTPTLVNGLSDVTSVSTSAFGSMALTSDNTVWTWGGPSSVPTQVDDLSDVNAIAAGESHQVVLKSDGTVWTWGAPSSVWTQVDDLSDVIAIAAGESHQVVLKSDGSVWAWGSYYLGSGNSSSSLIPLQIEGLENITEIASTHESGLALRSDGTVWIWAGFDTPAVQINGLTGIAGIAAGSGFNLALKSDGTVWAWGNNECGQLGNGTTYYSSTPVQVTGLSNVVYIGAGMYHCLAVKADGTLWAWGSNQYGQLGNGESGRYDSPVRVSNLSGIVEMDGGEEHTIALKSDGTVWAWGDNEDGELGDGSTTTRSSPVRVSWLTNIVSVSTGVFHSLALQNDGALWAWGSNWLGQLGNDSTVPSTVPVLVSGNGFSAISSGGFHNLALKPDGHVWSWGRNDSGQLGNGGTASSTVPLQLSGISGVVGISAGSLHSLALTSDNTVWAWGNNEYGRLGNGSTENSTVPVQVSSLTNVVAIAAGETHSLALKSDGTVWAWGAGSTTPVQVGGLTGIIAIAADGWHNLALKSDGSVWAWGFNSSGQLGNGTFGPPYIESSNVPAQVSGLGGVTAVAAGRFHSLAIVAGVAPTITTGAASQIGCYSAQLSGNITSLGSADSTVVYFQLGTTPGNYTITGPFSLPHQGLGLFEIPVAGLSAYTTYYYRAVAVGDAMGTGNEQSFTTLPLGPFNSMVYLGMNKVEPFTRFTWDPKARLATYLALDRDTLRTVAGGEKVVSIADPQVPNPNLNSIDHGQDMERATQLLYDSGYPNGFQTTLTTYPQWQSLADAVSVSLADVGIDCDVIILPDRDALLTELQDGQIEFFLMDTPVDWASPAEVLDRLLHTGADENFTSYSNAQFDAYTDTGLYLAAENVAFSDDPLGFTIAPLLWSPVTIPVPPVTTNYASYISYFSARLNGTLNILEPGTSANTSFQYGQTSGALDRETDPKYTINTGNFYEDITSFPPQNTYYFRSKVVIQDGNTLYGEEKSFMTTAAVTPPSFKFKWGSGANGQLSWPNSIALDQTGNVFVADSLNNRIQKFTSSGVFVTSWGSEGTGDGQFNRPYGVAVGPSGDIYVADYFNYRIQQFTNTGIFIRKWGTFGLGGSDELLGPGGVAVDVSGNVYVADSGHIHKFTSDGVFITKWGSYGTDEGQFMGTNDIALDASGNVYALDPSISRVQKFSDNGTFISKWGSAGHGDGQFYVPCGIAIDDDGYVYVTDGDGNRIQKFTSTGDFINKFGSHGSGDSQFLWPQDIAIDPSGNIYVADRDLNQIKKFSNSYEFIIRWGSSGDGWLNFPRDVALDSSGNVYVVDTNNNRIQKFSSSGTFIAKWGTFGTGDSQFNSPFSITIDQDDNVYVLDRGNHRVQKFTSSGDFITKWGSQGTELSLLISPLDITVDSLCNVYVTDSSDFSPPVQKFTSSGVFITGWGSQGNDVGQFEIPSGITVDDQDNVYVTDSDNCRIQKFSSSGTFLALWGAHGNGAGLFSWPVSIACSLDGNIYIGDSGGSVQTMSSSGDFITKWGSPHNHPWQWNNDGQFGLNLGGIAISPSGDIYVADPNNNRIQVFENIDTTPPAAITDLSPYNATATSVSLTWIAPGDDGSTGVASQYDIRYLPGVAITEANWASAVQVTDEPAPFQSGIIQFTTVYGLSPGINYYFAIKTADEVPNWSAISNIVVQATPTLDTTPPAAITNLASTGATINSISLSWTAPGDDDYTGTANHYDIRYLPGVVVTEANWSTAIQANGELVPVAAGSIQTATISSLSQNTTYYFAVKTADEVPNWSAISNVVVQTTSSAGGIAPRYGGTLCLVKTNDFSAFDDAEYPLFMTPTLALTNEDLLMGDWTKGPAGSDNTSWAYSMMPASYNTAGCLAESWEIDQTGNRLIFHIRHGVHFHNKPPTYGRELNANDVVFSLTRIWQSPYSYQSQMFPWATHLVSITAPDQWTVVIECMPGKLSTIYEWAGSASKIVPHEVVDQYGDLKDWHNSCGTGPFMLADYVPGSIATFNRNPDYWGYDPLHPANKLPYVDKVKWLIILDASTRLSALRTGKIDILDSIGWEDAQGLKLLHPQLQSLELPGYPFGLFMRTDNQSSPFKDVRVRRALAMAIDNQTIKDAFFGGHADVISWPVLPITELNDVYTPLESLPDSVQELYSYNPTRANQLLTEATYPDGFKTSIVCRHQDFDLLTIVQDMWADIGVDLEIQLRDTGLYWSIGFSKSYTDMYYGYTDSINPFAFNNLLPGSRYNYSMVDDPNINNAYQSISNAYFNEPLRRQLMKDIVPYILDQAYVLTTPTPHSFTMWQPWVGGYHGEQAVGSYGSSGNVAKYIWLTTGNNAPTAPVINITPDSPLTTDNLVCNITTQSSDAEGDFVNYTYAWYRNNVLQPGFTSTVPAASTIEGETWKCIVTPNDGITNGASGQDQVIIVSFPPASGGGSGGGGGGVLPGYSSLAPYTNSEGLFNLSAIVSTSDSKAKVDIQKGTMAKDAAGSPLRQLGIFKLTDTFPIPPTDSKVIGALYNFLPEGASFNPPITLSLTFGPADLTDGIMPADLYISRWDGTNWIALESSVDAANGTVSTAIGHFSQYAILGKLPQPTKTPIIAPATFNMSSVELSAASVKSGDEVILSVMVMNAGGVSGTYDVTLSIEGLEEQVKHVDLSPGASTKVSFSVVRTVPGTYQFDVNGKTGSFVIEAQSEPVIPSTTPILEAPISEYPSEPPWLIIGIALIAGGVLLGGGLVFLIARTRPR